jgi:glucose-fructose oxidoreductase
MIKGARFSRRLFLRKSLQSAAAGAAAPWVVAATALAGPSRCGANERLGIGYIGVGRRGNQLAPLPPEGRIVAAADCHLERAQQFAVQYGCRACQDYRELLDAPDVDAVIIATPDHWHVLPALQACLAGKDIYF